MLIDTATQAQSNTYNNKQNALIKVKYFINDIDKLKFVDGKSDWIDLRSSKDIFLKKGEFRLIPLGVGMKLPDGYEAHIIPRSSTFKNYGIIQTNSMGLIDHSYAGENDQWYFPALATRDVVVHKNDRICQFRIMKNQSNVNFCEVEHLEDKNRGGFGSTGRK